MTPATITPPERGLAPVTVQAIADAHGIAPDALAELRNAFRNETAPLCGISPATLAELSKLVTDDWLKLGVRIVGVTDADGGESIKVTVGLPTDGRRYLVGIAYDLAGAIANARPVYEVAA